MLNLPAGERPVALQPPDGDPGEPPETAPAAEPAGPSRTTVALAGALVLALSGAALFFAGLSLGSQGAGREPGERAAVEAFGEAYRDITREYVGEWDADELVQGAISGMFETLDDPYSGYLAPDEFAPTLADISGEFEGIGARMGLEDAAGTPCTVIGGACQLRVIEVLPASPALAAGLLAADVVQAVDGTALEGRSLDEAVRLVRGPRDSEVTLSLERSGQALQLPITRGVVVSQDVRSATLADGCLGYLRVDGFSSRVDEDLEAALRRLLDAGATGLVLDLRGDPGGFVDAAVSIASQFLDDGPVFWEEDAEGGQQAVPVRGDGLATDARLGLAVLVDGGTASASEMVAGALQDAGRARLVGQPTFGKGTVQEWTQLPGESGGFRLSVARWLTRDKRWVDGKGLQPDVAVAFDGERFWPATDGAAVDADAVRADPQLAAAVALLLGEDVPESAGVGAAGTSPGSPVPAS